MVGFRCCAVCGNAISAHQHLQKGTCDKTSCCHQHLSERRKKERDAHERRRRELAKEAWESLAASAPPALVGRTPLVATLPSNPRPLSPLPLERRQAFTAHLRERIEAAKSVESGQEYASLCAESPCPAPGGGDELEPEMRALLGNACAVCRGHCCRLGETHAYLSKETLLAYRRRCPDRSWDDVLAAYNNLLPEETYERSCVYHGSGGCHLPREMRSDVCNSYLCGDLIAIKKSVPFYGASSVFVAAIDDESVDRVGVIDHLGVHLKNDLKEQKQP